MSKLFARLERQRLAAEMRLSVERALRESEPAPTGPVGRHTPGDALQLRGIPVVGVKGGAGGAIRGTRPGDGLR